MDSSQSDLIIPGAVIPSQDLLQFTPDHKRLIIPCPFFTTHQHCSDKEALVCSKYVQNISRLEYQQCEPGSGGTDYATCDAVQHHSMVQVVHVMLKEQDTEMTSFNKRVCL